MKPNKRLTLSFEVLHNVFIGWNFFANIILYFSFPSQFPLFTVFVQHTLSIEFATVLVVYYLVFLVWNLVNADQKTGAQMLEGESFETLKLEFRKGKIIFLNIAEVHLHLCCRVNKTHFSEISPHSCKLASHVISGSTGLKLPNRRSNTELQPLRLYSLFYFSLKKYCKIFMQYKSTIWF